MDRYWVLPLCVLLLIPSLVRDQYESEFYGRPMSVNASLGMVAVFCCSSTLGDPGAQWRVNGTFVNRLPENTTDVFTNITVTTNGSLNCLYIQASEEHNNSVVECVIKDQQGNHEYINATRTVQGTLAPVGELTAIPMERLLHLTWNPPFTLDITNVTPDLSYCINIYNTTQHDLLNTVCGLIQPEFDFRVGNPSPCEQFRFEVIPVNGAGNGTSNGISGSLFNAPVLQTTPAVEVAVDPEWINVIFFFSETFHICTWRLYVNSSDDLPVVSFQLPDIPGGINTTGFGITIRSDILPFDRNYSIAIEGENSAGRALSPKFRLSTYDVQETTSVSDPVVAGRLNITCVFAANSSALGCLSIVRRNSTAMESFHVIKKSNNSLSIEDLDSDNYTVLTFDIEQDGLPGNRAAYIEEVELQHGSENKSENISAGATLLEPLNNDTLCLPCNSTSGCVVLLHSTSNQQHLGVHTTNFTQGANQTCVNASTCGISTCTVAVYEQSTDGVIDQPEPVFTFFSATPGFVSTPTSVNATLGSTTSFECSVTTGLIGWQVNGSLLSELNTPNITASQVGHTRFLHIPATEEYNNTDVVCILAIVGGGDSFSDPAVLQVQGLLDVVSNLKTDCLGPVIHLTWDAPFSLDITGVDPDIWYRVDITEAGAPLSTSSISRVVNISEFNFTMNEYRDTSSSVVYEFQVTPINGAGDGTTSVPVTGYFKGPPKSISAEMVVVETSADPLSVNFTITLGFIPPGEMPDQLQVYAETTDDENTVRYCTDDIPVTPGLNGNVFIQLNTSTPTCAHRSNSLKAYRRYSAIITAKNFFGENNSTGEILFSTHEVQTCSFNSHFRPGTVNIDCNFTENSNAMGYLPVLSSKTNSSLKIFAVAGRPDTTSSALNISISGIPPHNYTVVVFDLARNGLPPALSGNINYAAAEKENITVTNPGEAETDEVVSVNGTSVEVPDVTNTELNLCVSFNSSSSSDRIVVLAHHQHDPEKLSAYCLNSTYCTEAPVAGNYSIGVFNQTTGSILIPPATPPIISIYTVSIPTPMPTVTTTQTPFLWDATVGSILTVILLLTVVVIVVVVAVCVRTKRKKAGIHMSTDSEDHSSSGQDVEITTYKHIEEREEAVLKIPAGPGDEVKGKIDGTPGLPGSSGAIRPKACQHRTHDDSGTVPGTAGIPGPAEDSDDSGTAPGTAGIPGPAEDSNDSGIAPNNAGIPGPAEDSPPSSYYTGEKPRRAYQKKRSHQHQTFCQTESTVQASPVIETPPQQPAGSSSQLSIDDLVDVSTYLLTLQKEQIFSLGLVLGLQITSLNPIRDSFMFLDEMLAAWLQGKDRVNQKGGHTWESLVWGLKHPKVNQTEIAEKIESEQLRVT